MPGTPEKESSACDVAAAAAGRAPLRARALPERGTPCAPGPLGTSWGAALRGARRSVSALPSCRQRPAVSEEKPRGLWDSTVRDSNPLSAT